MIGFRIIFAPLFVSYTVALNLYSLIRIIGKILSKKLYVDRLFFASVLYRHFIEST